MSDEPRSGPLTVATHTRADAVVLTLEGELDLATADVLTATVTALPSDSTPVVLDMAGVEFVDSSGLRALLAAQGAVTADGRAFALARPHATVARLLDLVDLRTRFQELAGVEDADLASLRA